jgi:Rrf2 family protein
MSLDKKFATALHALLHMAKMKRPVTSTWLSEKLDCHPTIVRRAMTALKDLDIVDSKEGQGGGLIIAKPLDQIRLLDIYHALGSPRIFAIGNRKTDLLRLNDIDKTVNCFIYDSLAAAEDAFLEKLQECSLKQLFAEAFQDDDLNIPLDVSTVIQ